ncbi:MULTISPECIES: sensor histidine kinase [Variovorax]|jgi:signal transduction histidine kinase|uniref:sensor histidine kinase n=1 Tax=Variovorax TaxID=34072 RepID=UPI0008685E75|nr:MULTISPECIES: ATP-binding protein [Variovorax]MBN8752932.1 sensor histidine kinase [Variovorax sp.]ODU16809.1 MAG: two-component sensor histidine kinase [Variovorax sp. SCN 67-85]ODV25747.1 MAG: two-component sensor histidine kinase [Variovorax sp. SCN 67-20]OJZ15321.1 MAG: two-component sensor histidine kinase [Variovorax sp. 67-131]UKI08068.1 ATP-binding protein [Variovorax paradoxus]
MMQALAQRWKNWKQPSLMRRLLLAQMGVVALLWTMAVALLLYDSYEDPELLKYDKIFQTVLAISQNMADHPDKQQETLAAFDAALLETVGDGDAASDSSPVMQVWQGDRLIYRSTAAVPVILNSAPNRIETVKAGNREWRARTLVSATTDTRVMLAEPSVWRLTVTVMYRGYYLLPLVISLPFLIFPAWLSVRLALRPWRQVSKETAERGPADLTPLSYTPPHKELQPLVQSINSLLQRVRDSTSRERSLIADAAHELRTPLAAMRVNVEALKEQSTDEGQRELMGNLLRSNDRAARLVGQLLQLMRSDAVSDNALPVMLSLDGLVQDRLAMIEGLASARGIELELVCEDRVPVLGERESLVSMIDNLVNNAIKYSPSGSTVVVHVAHEGPHALLTVADQGPGIPAALRERVFDRFFRNPDQTQSGSGLGLAIVKSVIDRHGGEVTLGETAEGGLLVTVRLPLAMAEAPQPMLCS